MKILTLHLDGFAAYDKSIDITLDGVRCAALVGENHIGKTSLLRAIDYALFGADGRKVSRFVNRDRDRCVVRVTFDVGGHVWDVTRSHKADGKLAKLVVLCDGEPAGARDAATTQQVIHEAIGTNRDVARVTWMALSGDVDAMLTMRDAARRDLLAQVFGIDRYGELSKLVREAEKQAAHQVGQLELRLAGLAQPVGDPLDGVDLDEVAAQLAAQARLGDLVRAEQYARDRLADVTERGRAAAQAISDLPGVEAHAAQASQAATQAEQTAAQLAETLRQCRAALATARAQVGSLTGRVAEVSRELELVHGAPDGVCTSCGQHMDEAARQHTLAQLSRELDTTRLALGAAEQQAGQVADDEAQLSARHRDAEQTARSLQQQAVQAASSVKACAQLAGQAEAARQQVAAAEAELARAQVERQQAGAVQPAYTADEVAVARRARQVGEQAARDRQVVEEQLARVKEQQENWQLLVQAYAPSGIPMGLLRTVVDEVCADANDALLDMDSDVELAMSADGKTVQIEANGSDADCLSGQERFYAAIALHLAMSRCIERRTGRPLGTLLVDEGFGALDPNHVAPAVGALVAISEKTNVLAISHNDRVADLMPQRVEVALVNGERTVSVWA